MPSPDFDTVALVTVEENQDAFTVGLAEDETGEGAYIILQCSLAPPNANETATGLDTYCLLDENGAVQYGGVTHATLHDAVLTLTLTDEAAEELDVENNTGTITLTVPQQETARLAEGLHRIFTYGNPDKQPQLAGI